MAKFFVGDVHGHSEELKELLAICKYDAETDDLYFVGDLINCGPNSLEVLQIAYDLKAQVVLGNHERAFLLFCREGKFQNDDFANLKLELGEELEFWLDYMGSWPTYIEEDDFLLVHGGLHPDFDYKTCDSSITTMIREVNGRPWHEFYKGAKLVIYGHWAYQGLHILENSIGIDSGCAWGNDLTLLKLPGKEIFSVPSKGVSRSI